jgi:hypothetical protein
MLRAPLRLIEISVDSNSKEKYERTRIGASFDKLLANLIALKQAGIYDDVEPPSRAEKKSWKSLPFSESEFLAILRSMKRWRMDGRTLVLMGDSSTLVLSPASRTAQI